MVPDDARLQVGLDCALDCWMLKRPIRFRDLRRCCRYYCR